LKSQYTNPNVNISMIIMIDVSYHQIIIGVVRVILDYVIFTVIFIIVDNVTVWMEIVHFVDAMIHMIQLSKSQKTILNLFQRNQFFDKFNKKI
jgi:hypothetical protein